jgi:hypothetical protein
MAMPTGNRCNWAYLLVLTRPKSMARQEWPATIVDFQEVVKRRVGARFANLPIADAFCSDRTRFRVVAADP